RPQRLGQEGESLDRDGELAGARAKRLARHPHVVADVEVRELRVLLAQLIGAGVELDATRVVHEMREADLAMVAQGDQPAGDAHRPEGLELVLPRRAETAG